jgi:tetratricopeptide (TPR) repeat protein
MTLRSLYRAVLAGLVALGLAQGAHAQSAPTAGEAPPQDLYEKALQSIAEGRKNDASETLMQVIENEPNHAGAYLEVALIQCGLGRADEAERLFNLIIERFNPNPGIRDVIAQARAGGCSQWKALTSSSIMLARGYDNNVNQGARNPVAALENDLGQIELLPLLEDFLPRSDQYTALTADYMREVTPNGSVGFVQLLARHNDRERRFDSTALYAGLESPYRFGNWTLRTTAIAGAVQLGGKMYQRQMQLQARIGPPLFLPKAIQFSMIGGYTHARYLALTNFDSDTVELRGQFTYRTEKLYASGSVGYSLDSARDDRPGGDRKGPSLNMLVRSPLPYGTTGELAYSGQAWRGSSQYAPGTISQVRDQKTHMLRATLVYPLTPGNTLQLEGRFVRNSENISIFHYNNRLLQLSWHKQFQ